MRLVGGLLLLIAAPVGAQWPGDEEIPPVEFPEVRQESPTVEAFVPQGWKLEAKSVGDLNRDKLPDAALILHMDDPANRISTSWDKDRRYDTNPRMLLVAFAQPRGGYKLALTEHRLIPRLDNPNQDDPFEQIAIVKGTLRLKLVVFMSAGGWWMGNFNYSFRWQDGGFKMIGYDRDGVMRNSGETDRISINYLTRSKLLVTGNIDGGTATSRRKKLPKKPLLDMAKLGDGLMFDPDQP